MKYKVHIAFGFHVNLYHSFRGDTNDEKGFGKDIRIIRKIIKDLNNFNIRGVPVKATWDIENVFSLEDILPKYAPDIIEGIRNRVKKSQDEAIIMSYNNGLLSVMTDEEFNASIKWAISNEKGSGLQDLFGKYYPMVRPQEMTFTPSNIFLYNKLGINSLSLYYSAIPFDAFRTLVPLLKEELAYNPLWYKYKDERIAVIPTLSHGDLADYGSLYSLVKRLRKKQKEGIIDSDVLVFINMDADSELWYGLKMPTGLNWMPLTKGLQELVEDVAELDYVVLDTPGNYLDNHPPGHTITFKQDTADGAFDGYASWAEKPINHLIWTCIERARIKSDKINLFKKHVTKASNSDETDDLLINSFQNRIKLLSTTHFGLSSPVLNAERQKKVIDLSNAMLEQTDKAIKNYEIALIEKEKLSIQHKEEKTVRFWVLKEQAPLSNDADQREPKHGTHINATISFRKDIVNYTSEFRLQDESGQNIEASFLDTKRYEDGTIKELCIFFVYDEKAEKKLFRLSIGENKKFIKNSELFLDNNTLKGEGIEVIIGDDNQIKEISAFGDKIGENTFFESYINYNNERCGFITKSKKLLKSEEHGNLIGYRLNGIIQAPSQTDSGKFEMDLFITEGISALMMRAAIQYPYTKEEDLMYNEVAALQRYYDSKWVEVAPMQIHPILGDEIKVHKHNYQQDLSNYNISDFKKADPQNEVLDSFNNQISAGFIGVGDDKKGILVATHRYMLNSLAFCPMRTIKEQNKIHILLNPFGTYFGKQRNHATYGSGLAQEIAVYSAPQFKSIAPAYNGVYESFMLGIFPYKGEEVEESLYKKVNLFCDGSSIIISPNSLTLDEHDENVKLHEKSAKEVDATNVDSKSIAKSLPLSLKMKLIWSALKAKLIP